MKFSSVLQFSIGFLMGVALLVGAGAATAYYFFTRLSSAPPKPEFPPEPEVVVPPPAEPEKPVEIAVEPPPEATAAEVVEEEPEKPKTIQDRFGQSAYRARVTWPQGLSLRAEPNLQGARIGGVYHNDEVIAIGTSADGRWQKIHIPASGQEAWVKAGNVARLD